MRPRRPDRCSSRRKTLTFLRALEAEQRRRVVPRPRADYDTHIQAPLHRAARAARRRTCTTSRPELACSPRESTFRMYRDTRFSEDKTPLKTHVALVAAAARLPQGLRRRPLRAVRSERDVDRRRALPPRAGGAHAVREHIAAQPSAAAGDRANRRRSASTSDALEGDTLTRVPRGFDPPITRRREYLKLKDLDGDADRSPATFATTPRFYATLRRHLPRRGAA